MVTPTKAKLVDRYSQAYMCYVCNSLGMTLPQETLDESPQPNEMSFFWNQVTCSLVHKHAHNKNIHTLQIPLTPYSNHLRIMKEPS